jgi:hypothetical protein
VNFCLNPPHLVSDLAEIRYEKSAHNDVEHRTKFIFCVSNTFLLINTSFTSIFIYWCLLFILYYLFFI